MRKYMSKSARACDYCRARKSACRIETAPPCRLCSISGRECVFTESSSNRPRKGPQNSTVQSTQSGGETSAAHQSEVHNSSGNGKQSFGLSPTTESVLEHSHGHIDDITNMASDFHDLDNMMDFQHPSGWSDHEWLDQTIMSMNVGGFAPISTPPYNHTLTDQPSTVVEHTSPIHGGHDDTYSVLCGLSGDMDPNLMRRYRFGPDGRFVFKRLAIRSMSQSKHPVQLLMAPRARSDDATTSESIRHRLEELVSQDIGRSFIKLFYQFVYPHVPICSTTKHLDPQKTESWLLAAVYLVTLQFANFDDYLSVQIAYEPPDPKRLYDLALSSIHKDMDQPDFSHLQTTILLLVTQSANNLLMPDYSVKYTLVGNMVTLAGTLGLQLDPSNWSISRDEMQLRKRLAWTVKMADVWNAAALGRSCLISDDDWIVPPPVLSDFTIEEQASGFPAQLLLMYDLTLVLREVLRSLFSLRSINTLAEDYDLTLRTAQPLVEQLNRWSNKATELQSGSGSEEADSSGPHLLGQHFVKVLIFRAILRPFIHKTGHTSDSAAQQREAEAQRLSRAGAKACVAAFTAFTSNLKSSWIHAFWPFWCTLAWSTLNNLALLLCVTAGVDEDAEECKSALERARKVTRLQSKSFEILKFSSLRIDSIFWKGLDNVLETKWNNTNAFNISDGLG